jgi:peptide chain release factor subunit 1
MAHLTGVMDYDRGLAILAGPGLWETLTLRVAPRLLVRYGEGVYIGPLVAMLDEHQRVAVAVVDNERARLLVVRNGEIEARESFRDDVPKRHGQTEHRPNIERHHAVEVERHLENALADLQDLRRRFPFRRLVLGGASEALPKFQRLLPKELNDIVAGTMRVPMYGTDSEIIREAAGIATAYERKKEQETVDQVITRAAKREAAVAGADETLLALRKRQVFELVVAEGADVRGFVCEACGTASTRDSIKCPICSAAMRKNDDLVEVAIGQALATGARIEVVFGPAKEALLEEDGLGALIAHTALKT